MPLINLVRSIQSLFLPNQLSLIETVATKYWQTSITSNVWIIAPERGGEDWQFRKHGEDLQSTLCEKAIAFCWSWIVGGISTIDIERSHSWHFTWKGKHLLLILREGCGWTIDIERICSQHFMQKGNCPLLTLVARGVAGSLHTHTFTRKVHLLAHMPINLVTYVGQHLFTCWITLPTNLNNWDLLKKNGWKTNEWETSTLLHH